MGLLKDKPVYIFGAKYLGRKLARILKEHRYDVRGFFDNNIELQGTIIDGLKVSAPYFVCAPCQIIIASITYVYPIQKQSESLGYEEIIPYPVLTLEDEKLFPPEPSLDGLRRDVTENIDKYRALEFCDEYSYEVLETIIEFRRTYDFSLLNRIRSEKEYFESFMPDDLKIFIDGGAYDGDTALKFIGFVKGNYEKILLFEPDKISFQKAKERLKNHKNIRFYNCGLLDENTKLGFCSTGEPGSSFDVKGTELIECRRLDDIIDEKAYIKLDVEGAEIRAIKGARNLLEKGSALALCVYHKPSHIWEIPELVKSINPDYRFYLRHYSDSVFDTILYGVADD